MNMAVLIALLNDDFKNAMIASTPAGIENQEKRGQTDFVASETLPIEMPPGCSREKLEDMGVVFGENIDNLLVSVSLPEGWAKRPTDHSMWSELVDENGVVVARIFYKAAFYDRRAYVVGMEGERECTVHSIGF